MTLDEGKAKFIQAFGALGSKWGINRTMAQVHALLLISPASLSADDIMETLNISRGNANMNLRALIDWGLIQKEHKLGERKEFFVAEKDVWRITKQIIIERKKRELDPIKTVLRQLQDVEGTGVEVEEFTKVISDLNDFADLADNALERFTKVEKDWILNSLLKVIS